MKTVQVEDAAELAERSAALMRELIELAIEARGVARIALSGGSTPGEGYRRLARSGLDVSRCRWFFVDERCVPPDSERSNYRSARSDLFDPAGIRSAHVFRMPGEESAVVGARTYADTLARELAPAEGRLDLLIAGIGNDGHTASLFPNTGAVQQSAAVVAVEPGGGLESRISLGRPTLLAARHILVLVSGAGKRDALALALEPGDEDVVPARLYLAAPDGVVTLIVDRAARG